MKRCVQPVQPFVRKAEAGASERKGLGDQRQVGSPIKITHFAPLEVVATRVAY